MLKPPPLVERYLRRVVDERVDGRGNVERALDPKETEREVDVLLKEGVEAIAVCLLNSFANPAHELAIKAIIGASGRMAPITTAPTILTLVANTSVVGPFRRGMQNFERRWK